MAFNSKKHLKLNTLLSIVIVNNTLTHSTLQFVYVFYVFPPLQRIPHSKHLLYNISNNEGVVINEGSSKVAVTHHDRFKQQVNSVSKGHIQNIRKALPSVIFFLISFLVGLLSNWLNFFRFMHTNYKIEHTFIEIKYI